MKFPSGLPVLLAASLFAGCGTIGTKTHGQIGDKYSGVKCSGRSTGFAAVLGILIPPVWIVVPFGIVDTILSGVADTLFLPFDLMAKKKDFYPDEGCWMPNHMSSLTPPQAAIAKK